MTHLFNLPFTQKPNRRPDIHSQTQPTLLYIANLDTKNTDVPSAFPLSDIILGKGQVDKMSWHPLKAHL